MNRAILLSGAAGVLSLSGPAHAADDAAAVAARFGALEAVRDASISPDGTKVAVVNPVPTGTVVVVADLTGAAQPKMVMGMQAKDGRITSCSWSTDTRIVCFGRYIVKEPVYGPVTYSRVFATNADATGMVQLSSETNDRSHYVMQYGGGIIDLDVGNSPGSVLMTRQFVPDTQTGSRMGSDKEGVGVEAVDTITLKRRTVEEPRRNASEYVSDGHGLVRVMGVVAADSEGVLKGTTSYFYRKTGSRDWLPLSVVASSGAGLSDGFDPYAVDSAANVVYGFEGKGGFNALYSVSLDGAATRAEVLSRADTDIDELIRIGRDRRVVGASYATDRRAIEYFDPELKKLGAALTRALPGQPMTNIVDASAGEKKLLIIASADVDPGILYVYDKASRKLDQVMAVRGALEGVPLAPMKAISYKAADGTEIPAYLTLPLGSSGKGLPAIVMPHGGPAARDEWGFDWLVQFYAARGFAVIQPNYRGSTGYGSAWFQKNGFQSWKTAISDINDAGRWLLAEGIAAPGKLAAVGWSYGGYAALQGEVVDPALYKAVVAIAPVTDLASLKRESANFTNSRLVDRYIGDGPHLREGSPAEHAARFAAPVMLFHGDLDQNVGVDESRLMEKRLREAGKPVTYVEFAGLDHYLIDAAARTRMLSESDAFLRKALGLAP
ncbi:alpha/beta hydrolase family protein [Novosphingobium flavum]|nr:S9 family peptidase [Novosphingobium flavum]